MGIPAWKLAACALLCAMGACRAQAAVTVYGIVDAGLAYIDNGARHGASSVAMRSGILSGSLVGLQGSEELGEGLRAVFQLETDFNLGNGQAATYYGDPASATAAEPRGQPIAGGFNRRAYVGVESRHGSLSLGRDYTPLYWSMVEVDPLKLAGYGNMQQIVQLSGTGSERFGRASNALFYATPVTSDGLQLRLMGSFGSQGWGGPDRRPADANRMGSLGRLLRPRRGRADHGLPAVAPAARGRDAAVLHRGGRHPSRSVGGRAVSHGQRDPGWRIFPGLAPRAGARWRHGLGGRSDPVCARCSRGQRPARSAAATGRPRPRHRDRRELRLSGVAQDLVLPVLWPVEQHGSVRADAGRRAARRRGR
ncbi:porin [Achromobacter xylosoxidans]